jgi:hypothetical protein
VKPEVLRPFLEKALAQWAGRDEVEPDEDGDYTFRHGSAEFFVRLIKEDPPILRFWSVLLKTVKSTPKVFRLLNTINSVLGFARVYWKDELIILALEVPTDNVDARQVAWACDMVGVLADDLDTKLKHDVGGKLAFPDSPEDDEDAVKV